MLAGTGVSCPSARSPTHPGVPSVYRLTWLRWLLHPLTRLTCRCGLFCFISLHLLDAGFCCPSSSRFVLRSRETFWVNARVPACRRRGTVVPLDHRRGPRGTERLSVLLRVTQEGGRRLCCRPQGSGDGAGTQLCPVTPPGSWAGASSRVPLRILRPPRFRRLSRSFNSTGMEAAQAPSHVAASLCWQASRVCALPRGLSPELTAPFSIRSRESRGAWWGSALISLPRTQCLVPRVQCLVSSAQC